MAHSFLLCFAAGAVIACTSTKDTSDTARFGGPSPADSLFFSIERTPCFGRCPAYTVNVYRNGNAMYDGRTNAPRTGPHSSHLSTTQMEALLSGAERISFFNLQDSYDGQVTDLPSVYVRVVSGDRDKKVHGRYKTPMAFKNYAATADSILESLPWQAMEKGN